MSSSADYEGKPKSNGSLKKKSTFTVNINETNIAFQRNPPRLQRTESRVSQVF
jgi:hypothetical protein